MEETALNIIWCKLWLRTILVFSATAELGSSEQNPNVCQRCYDFKNIFAKKMAKKLAFLTLNKGKL
jgi:hypothetical protein